MTKTLLQFAAATVLTLTLAFAGCSDTATETTDTTETVSEMPPATIDTAHAHPSEGPHHGSLIELGAEEYHAELVHDDESGSVTIYILDSAAKTAVPIDATELTVNLKHDGNAEQFKLAASPDTNDSDGKSSRFISTDKELGEDLHGAHADATLVVMIDGKSFRGAIKHDDHAGHSH
jgi:hypothetical protein